MSLRLGSEAKLGLHPSLPLLRKSLHLRMPLPRVMGRIDEIIYISCHSGHLIPFVVTITVSAEQWFPIVPVVEGGISYMMVHRTILER